MSSHSNGPPPLLKLTNLSRRFPGVLALDDVDFEVQPGEVHALVGENGAGKSTLINVLAGVIQPTLGTVELDGKQIVLPDPASAQHAGIGVIFQEFNLLPDLSVAENIYMNREPTRGIRIDWTAMNSGAKESLALLNVDVDPRTPVGELPVAQQQLVEIARSLSFKSKIIVMDEPTAALSEREVDTLLEIVRSLAERGVGVVYVSHRLSEVFTVADRITVLRDGQHILTESREDLTEQNVVSAMVGRELLHTECPPRQPQKAVLTVRDLAVEDAVSDVSFTLHSGEVLGLAGLMGSGCTEVLEALFGLRTITGGEVLLNEESVSINRPRAAIHSGLGFVPDDRKRAGILPDLSVMHNVSIGMLDRLQRFFWINGSEERKLIDKYRDALGIRYSRASQMISGLSGGNQQKAVVARSLAEECQVLMLAEPTRGVDVGAKVEIYALIDSLVKQGMAVLLQSSELPEILRLANRCIVFAAGQPQGELSGADLNQERIVTLATGLEAEQTARKGDAV